MADENEIFEFLEADNAAGNSQKRQRRKRLRQGYDPFNIDETEFVSRYRLTKELAHTLCDEMRPLLKKPIKSTDLSIETKVLTALSFYASGSYQRPIGNKEGHIMAQQTVSSVIAQVTTCLNSVQMRQKYIHFPANDQERTTTKSEFYNKFNIPGVLGCIGSTHVAIVRPVLNEEHYFCCKRYHSLNVQLICDANMQITSVDASHGGATHYSSIWANHPLRAHLDDLSNTDNTWFLGDTGYSLSKSMMTPILNSAPNTPEAHYTNLHFRARNIMEHAIGLLKARFRCLLALRCLHYSPEMAGSIVNACVILHNICNKANAPVQELSDEEMKGEARLQLNHAEVVDSPHIHPDITWEEGWSTRSSLVQQLWDKRHI